MNMEEYDNTSEFQNVIECKKIKYDNIFSMLNEFVRSLNQEFMFDKQVVKNQVIDRFVFFYNGIYIYMDYTYSDFHGNWKNMWNCNDDCWYSKENHIFINEIKIKYDDFEENESLLELKHRINQLEMMISFTNM